MKQEQALQKLTIEQAEAIQGNTTYAGGPYKPTRADVVGELNFTCPTCNVVLVENTTMAGVKATFRKIQCYNCRNWCAP